MPSTVQSTASGEKPERLKRDTGPLLPFEELVDEIEDATDDSCKPDEDGKSNALKDCSLPEPCGLLWVTNRRKMPPRNKSLPMVCNHLFPLHFLIPRLGPNFCTSARWTMNWKKCKQNMKICF